MGADAWPVGSVVPAWFGLKTAGLAWLTLAYGL